MYKTFTPIPTVQPQQHKLSRLVMRPTAVNKMRPLTEDESKTVFEKLANYIVCCFYLPSLLFLILLAPKGKNLVHLVDRQDESHCFRLHKDRVYYVSEALMRLSISVARSNLVSMGTCLGKFSKSGKFKLHITSLDYLAQYAKYKVSFVSIPCAYYKRL
jgi:60S ribosome subunit biogenesis protein NIP7